MEIYRFLVTSVDSIHGIRLRKLIKGIADKSTPQIFGESKNLDDEHEVEVICSATNMEEVQIFKNKIIKLANDKTDIDVTCSEAILVNDLKQWKNFKEFKVVRADSLKEIDLAIEGAEKLFRKLQENFKTFLVTRENIKLKGLDYGLKKIAGNLTHDKPKTKWHIEKNAISDFLAEPFNDDLFQTLQEIDQLLYELSEFEGQEIDKLPNPKIQELLRLIGISSNKIKELHGKMVEI